MAARLPAAAELTASTVAGTPTLALGPSARGGPASTMLTAFANREMTSKDALRCNKSRSPQLGDRYGL